MLLALPMLIVRVPDLGPNAAQWGEAPWPSELGQDTKACVYDSRCSKFIADT